MADAVQFQSAAVGNLQRRHLRGSSRTGAERMVTCPVECQPVGGATDAQADQLLQPKTKGITYNYYSTYLLKTMLFI